MENQHRKIKGYRELTQQEIDLMNEIKEKGEDLSKIIKRLNNLNFEIHSSIKSESSSSDVVAARESDRWVSIGKTHLQQGLMALTRAVAKPDFF